MRSFVRIYSVYRYTIRVWNTMTGGMEADPFTGHSDPVESGILTR